MILLLDTSTMICRLTFIYGKLHQDYEWESNRNLAKGLLGYIKEKLDSVNKNWDDITAIGVFEGPGSFTGLRIGITVMNTIADAQNIPIVAGRGINWQDEVIKKLDFGKNEKIILPFYGTEAHITKSRK